MNKQTSTTLTLGPVRISRHNLFTPYSQGGSAEDSKYTITVLIPKADLESKASIDAAIEAAAQEALHTKWNGVAPVPLITPLHDGDGMRPNGESYAPECAGHYVLTANTKTQPEVVDATLQPLTNTREIYRGVWVYVSVTFFSYMRNGKKGLGCGLGPVMRYMDDDPLDGRLTAKNAFAAVAAPVAQTSDAPFAAPIREARGFQSNDARQTV
jgi:hypothetical protein